VCKGFPSGYFVAENTPKEELVLRRGFEFPDGLPPVMHVL